jgi:phosphomannomutase
MVLIKSISGIRGTIGGRPGEGLSPFDILKYVSAYAVFLRGATGKEKISVVLGRDARISGDMVNQLVLGTLMGMGVDVVDLGLSTTPTVEMSVQDLEADGGIIITASHNPAEWNALKLLNNRGEFLSAEDGQIILEIADRDETIFYPVEKLGSCRSFTNAIQQHISRILALPAVNAAAIKQANLKVVIDAVNSTGGLALEPLLKSLGVSEVIEINTEPTGLFAHNPEPLPENLKDLSLKVKETGADLGFAVDPDVDRLAIVMEDGKMFGEEYTLVAVADYILGLNPGNTVSNLSSTRALKDITEKAGGAYYPAAVGEVNVVQIMKECNAVIGGEGNGGIIYPDLHYGRDALVGAALFLSHLATSGKSCRQLRHQYPDYHMSKNKINLSTEINIDHMFHEIASGFKGHNINFTDGLKIDFDSGWVHLRKSNTEPIIRIYAESTSEAKAKDLAGKFLNLIEKLQ